MEKCVNEYVGEGAGVKENFHKVCAMDVTQTLQYMRGVESCVVRELGPKKMEEFSDAVTQMEEEKSDEEIWEEEVQCYKNALGAQQ